MEDRVTGAAGGGKQDIAKGDHYDAITQPPPIGRRIRGS
jgi:hypothetical protein